MGRVLREAPHARGLREFIIAANARPGRHREPSTVRFAPTFESLRGIGPTAASRVSRSPATLSQALTMKRVHCS